MNPEVFLRLMIRSRVKLRRFQWPISTESTTRGSFAIIGYACATLPRIRSMPEQITWNDIHTFMNDLRSTAQQLLRLEGNAQTLQPTALVLTALRRQKTVDRDWNRIAWNDRNYFFRSMHTAMRRALVDHARMREAKKRQVHKTIGIQDIRLDDLPRSATDQPEIILALDEALRSLSEDHPKWVELIQHRYFEGLTIEDCATVLEISEPTAKRWWRRAKLLLHDEIMSIVNQDETGKTNEETR